MDTVETICTWVDGGLLLIIAIGYMAFVMRDLWKHLKGWPDGYN